jgi:excisionase family DNA binding protein
MAVVMTIKETASVTGISQYTIRKGIKEGVFPAFRIGGIGSKYFIDINEFQNAINDLSKCNLRCEINESTSISPIRRIVE